MDGPSGIVGPAALAELLKLAHVPLPLANAWLATLLEIFGGLALLMGAFVAIVSIPLILSMTFCLPSTAGSRLASQIRKSDIAAFQSDSAAPLATRRRF